MTRRITALAVGALTLLVSTTVTAAAVPETQASRAGTFYGTYQRRDGCPYLRSPRGYHYYLVGYRVGGNGGLYKSGGGFIAYPGWRIKARGTVHHYSGVTTLCTTWGANYQIKAKSIYAY
ncbi:hypothetical protein N5079_09105 [Planotetraspora sp. A-T 1434]|uniref:hypothetical protein n=1 Tax=Planotetraspora sp. A-T 1434 TaxID=2979219 RepID=UPI0021C147CF|nr:hypothetical protein [Planotetraspora sp. A-T 1434]MCT9930382.1 hypothetical protein [Planotetraspora sp. A-T 1434]